MEWFLTLYAYLFVLRKIQIQFQVYILPKYSWFINYLNCLRSRRTLFWGYETYEKSLGVVVSTNVQYIIIMLLGFFVLFSFDIQYMLSVALKYLCLIEIEDLNFFFNLMTCSYIVHKISKPKCYPSYIIVYTLTTILLTIMTFKKRKLKYRMKIISSVWRRKRTCLEKKTKQ